MGVVWKVVWNACIVGNAIVGCNVIVVWNIVWNVTVVCNVVVVWNVVWNAIAIWIWKVV